MSSQLSAKITADNSQFIKALGDSISQMQRVVTNLTDMAQNARDTSISVDNASDSVDNASKSLQRIYDLLKSVSKELEKTSGNFEKLDRNIGQNQATQEKANSTAQNGTAILEQFAAAIMNAGSATEAFSKGAMALASGFGASSLQAAILEKGVEACCKIITFFIEQAKEASQYELDMLQDTIRYTNSLYQKTEKARSEEKHQATALAELASQEKLSNSQKLEQLQLLEKLKGKYEELENASVNAAGKIVDAQGRIVDMTNVAAKAMDKANAKRMNEIETQIRQLNTLETLLKTKQEETDDKNDYNKITEELAGIAESKNDLRAERHALSRRTDGSDYLRRQQAKRQDELDARHETAATKLSELKKQQDMDSKSVYDRRRQQLEDNIASMTESLTTEELKDLEAYRLEELRKIDAEEQDELQKSEQEKLKLREKALEERQKLEENAERQLMAAQARLQDTRSRNEALQNEQRRRRFEASENARITRLQQVNARLDRRMSSFGFNLNNDYTNESDEARKRRISNMRLDSTIARKLAAQEQGRRVHFTDKETARLDEYRALMGKKEKNNAQLEQLNAAAQQRSAALESRKAADELRKAAQEQEKAAQAVRDLSGGPVGNHPNARLEMPLTRALSVGETAGLPEQVIKSSAIAAASAADYSTPLANILGVLQELKSNVYIAR